jgi:hypothetical protein
MSRGLVNNMLTMNNLGDGSTLSLDFTTMGGVLDPRLTFSRASTATFVNSSGYVAHAGANLLLQSGNLSLNGTGEWTTRTNLTLTGWTGFVDPLGGSTAVKIIPDTTNATHLVGTGDISLSIGIPYTVSVYVKASGYNIVGLVTTNANARAHFNLSNQTSAGYGVTNTRTITDVGSGWYRITMSFTVANGPLVSLWIYAMNTATDPVANSFAGVSASTDGVLAWGAQLNPGSTAQTYYPTTTAAYHAPRFDYSPTNIGEPRGLLVEGQAVNKAINSETFAQPFYVPNDTTVTVDSGDTNPRGTLGSVWFAPTTNGGSRFLGPSLTGVSTTTKTTYSLWLKAKGTNTGPFLLFNSVGIITSSGVIISQPAGASASFTGNGTVAPTINNLSSAGWTRVAITTDAVLGGTGKFDAFLYPKSTTGQTTSDSLYVWGAQIEEGSGASSYIPTGASQVTRNADSCLMSGTNFSSWFNNTEGTCLFVGDNSFVPAASNFSANWALISAANSMRINNYTRHTSGRLGASPRDSGGTALTFDSPTGSPTNITTTAVYKTAFAMKTNDFAYCVNGNTVGLGDGNGVFDTVTSIEFARDGIRNGHMKQFKFYPTRLTNAELQAITAP